MPTTPTRPVRFTYRDYLLLPEGDRRELIGGEFLVVPAPTPHHQRVSARLQRALHDFVEANGLGEVFDAPIDVVLSEENVVQPDLIFVARDRASVVRETHVAGAPDLVVEIVSPSTADRDRETKRRLYFKYGVREYWLVDPGAGTIEVLVPGAADFETHRVFPRGTRLSSPLLPGLSIPVEDIVRPGPSW